MIAINVGFLFTINAGGGRRCMGANNTSAGAVDMLPLPFRGCIAPADCRACLKTDSIAQGAAT